MGRSYLRPGSVADPSSPFLNCFAHESEVLTTQEIAGGVAYSSVRLVTFDCMPHNGRAAVAPAPPKPKGQAEKRGRGRPRKGDALEKGPAIRPKVASGSQLPYLRVMVAGSGSRPKGAKPPSPVMEWAHRILCWVRNGPPPGNQFGGRRFIAGHLCGDPLCCCLAHLVWMTPSANRACRDWHLRHKREGDDGPTLYPGPYIT